MFMSAGVVSKNSGFDDRVAPPTGFNVDPARLRAMRAARDARNAASNIPDASSGTPSSLAAREVTVTPPSSEASWTFWSYYVQPVIDTTYDAASAMYMSMFATWSPVEQDAAIAAAERQLEGKQS